MGLPKDLSTSLKPFSPAEVLYLKSVGTSTRHLSIKFAGPWQKQSFLQAQEKQLG